PPYPLPLPLHDALPIYDFHRAAVLLGWAELDDLGSRRDRGRVPGGRVVGVAGLVCLGMAGVREGGLAAYDIAPVRALAAVVGQRSEEHTSELQSLAYLV